MANQNTLKKKRKKGARKKFFDVSIPLTSSKVKLYAYDPEDLEGSTVKLDFTKNLRGKNLEVRSRVFNNNGNLEGDLLSLRLIQSYLKRIMRRGTDYIEDSFTSQAKDAILRIKPFMITRKRASRAVLREIRNIARKQIESYVTIRTKDEIFSDIVTNKLQKTIAQKAKKIYPLALCEIRIIELVKKIEKPENKKETDSKKE